MRLNESPLLICRDSTRQLPCGKYSGGKVFCACAGVAALAAHVGRLRRHGRHLYEHVGHRTDHALAPYLDVELLLSDVADAAACAPLIRCYVDAVAEIFRPHAALEPAGEHVRVGTSIANVPVHRNAQGVLRKGGASGEKETDAGRALLLSFHLKVRRGSTSAAAHSRRTLAHALGCSGGARGARGASAPGGPRHLCQDEGRVWSWMVRSSGVQRTTVASPVQLQDFRSNANSGAVAPPREQKRYMGSGAHDRTHGDPGGRRGAARRHAGRDHARHPTAARAARVRPALRVSAGMAPSRRRLLHTGSFLPAAHKQRHPLLAAQRPGAVLRCRRRSGMQ